MPPRSSCDALFKEWWNGASFDTMEPEAVAKRAWDAALALQSESGLRVAPSAGVAFTDDDLRRMWKAAGGTFHGPNVEHGTMPEENLLRFLREITGLKPRSAIEQIKHTAGRQRQADADFLYRQAEKGDAIFRRTAEYLADLVSKNTLIDAADSCIEPSHKRTTDGKA